MIADTLQDVKILQGVFCVLMYVIPQGRGAALRCVHRYSEHRLMRQKIKQ